MRVRENRTSIARVTRPCATPRVWAVASYRAGENSQIIGLAERLGWEFAVKRLQYSALAGPTGLLRGVGVAGIAPAARAALVPPWPDLVISAGVKNEPVCRWVQRQSNGAARLVFLGRTWASRRAFDLVITTPQYRLPREPNVRHNLMTQHGVTAARIAAAGAAWRDRFAAYPSPRVGVLVGGDSGPFVFGVNAARRLACDVQALCRRLGATALVTTSARTRPEATAALSEALGHTAFVHRWRPDDPDNPYFGILAVADQLVVTSDSIAMLSEAAATRSPLHIFDLDAHEGPNDSTAKSRAYALMMRLAPARLSRDLGLFHDAFIAAGHAVRLGESVGQPGPGVEAEAEATVARVKALLRGGASAT